MERGMPLSGILVIIVSSVMVVTLLTVLYKEARVLSTSSIVLMFV